MKTMINEFLAELNENWEAILETKEHIYRASMSEFEKDPYTQFTLEVDEDEPITCYIYDDFMKAFNKALEMEEF